jgi:glycosyltransferase involved in cell wall biosynthesis
MKVAAIFITFNQKDFVENSLQSLFDQTYQNFDIVISDDHSTDGTFEILQDLVSSYSGHHKIILNRNLQNFGIGKNTQIAINLCEADFYITCDGDDISTKDRFSKLIDFFQEDKVKINLIATDAYLMTKSSEIQFVKISTDLQSINSVSDLLAAKPIFFGATTAFTKDLIIDYPDINEGVYGVDQIMLLRSMMKGGAKTLHEPLVYHREGGVTGFQASNIYEKINRFKIDSVRSIADISQMILDSRSTVYEEIVYQKIYKNLAIEKFIYDMFSMKHLFGKIKLFFACKDVPIFKRIRFFSYATFGPFLNILWILKIKLKSIKSI